MSQGPVPFLYCDLYKRAHGEKTVTLSCHYKCDYSTNALIIGYNCTELM